MVVYEQENIVLYEFCINEKYNEIKFRLWYNSSDINRIRIYFGNKEVFHMRLEQLKYLVDVAQTKSMSKTAEKFFLSPQAISKSIKQLEQELDTELLIRTNQGVGITKVGEEVVIYAKQMLDEEEKMNQSIAKSKLQGERDNTFSIQICSTSAIINIVLPTILAKYASVNIKMIPRITMVDSLQEVLDRVARGESDLGLVTYNEEELFRKFSSYQKVLDMDLLARDELVIAMDRRLYQGQKFLSVQEHQSHFRTMYCVLPIDEMMPYAKDINVMRSDDAAFHREMMKKVDAYVTMPKLAYQHFFSSKTCVALPLENTEMPLLHAAVYRKDGKEELKKFASMIRVGLT